MGSVVDSQDTFLHELGHSLGSSHDPTGRDCSEADSGAHFLMWPGAVSTGQVVRELSPCSLREMNSALDGFPDSCLEGFTSLASNSSSTIFSTSTPSSTSPTDSNPTQPPTMSEPPPPPCQAP